MDLKNPKWATSTNLIEIALGADGLSLVPPAEVNSNYEVGNSYARYGKFLAEKGIPDEGRKNFKKRKPFGDTRPRSESEPRL